MKPYAVCRKRRASRRKLFEKLESRLLLAGDVGLDWFAQARPATVEVNLQGGGDVEWSPFAWRNAADGSSRWIVHLRERAWRAVDSFAEIDQLLHDVDVTLVTQQGLGVPGQIMVEATAASEQAVSDALRTNPHVLWFEVDSLVFAQETDPRFAEQDGLENTGQTGGVNDADIDASTAWTVETGSRSVVVAVIDSGIDAKHPDLFKNVWINQGEIPSGKLSALTDTDSDGRITFVDLNHSQNNATVTDGNGNGFIDAEDLLNDATWADGLDNDQNGDETTGLYVDDLFGWDFVDNDNNPFDEHGHGTSVAGIIGAEGGNGEGIAGVNWAVSIMPLRFLNERKEGSSGLAAKALNYANMMRTGVRPDELSDNISEANIRVVNGSFSSPILNQALSGAVLAAAEAEILFVAAAGNGNFLSQVFGRGNDNDILPIYPAGLAAENVISVAATDNSDELATFSNFGATTVDLAAPGVGILTTRPAARYGSRNGTSMAAPFATGVAALVYAEVLPQLSDVTVGEVRDAVLLGANVITTSLGGKLVTEARLNAAGALTVDAFAPRTEVPAIADWTNTADVNLPFSVIYRDDVPVGKGGVKASTLGNTDVQIRNVETGETFAVTLPAPPANDAAELTASYELAPIGGSWGVEDNGLYEILLLANEVTDIHDRPARSGRIGQFLINVQYVGQIDVDTEADELNGATNGTSLREAIAEANLVVGENTIVLGEGTFALSLTGNDADGGDLDVTEAARLTIIGAGSHTTILQGGDIDRLLDVAANATLALVNLTIEGGNATLGGGIQNAGTLELDNVTIKDNEASAGGAIYNTGTVEIWSSALSRRSAGTIASNSAAANGAGIYNDGGTVSLENTTISSNVAAGNGGGIYQASGTVTLANVTIAQNTAGDGGVGEGGGVSAAAGTVNLKNTIIATNSGSSNPDIQGAFTTQENNLIGDGGTATGISDGQNGDLVGTGAAPVDPLLGPLDDNDGPTLTHLLLSGSPAIDGGTDTNAPTNWQDQRGFARPQNEAPDIGAVERFYAEIRGQLVEDADNVGSGVPNTALVGWTIYIDENENGSLDPGELSTTSIADNPATEQINEAGQFHFPRVVPGRVVVRVDVVAGWETLYPLNGTSLPATITLESLDGTLGAKFEDPRTEVGFLGALDGVSPLGDINGDGFDDLLIANPRAYDLPVGPFSAPSFKEGRVFVVYGRSSFDATTDVNSVDDGDGGFRLEGRPADIDLDMVFGPIEKVPMTGLSVSGNPNTSDINGDGFPDFIVAEPGWYAPPPEIAFSRTYIIYGDGNNIDLDSVTLGPPAPNIPASLDFIEDDPESLNWVEIIGDTDGNGRAEAVVGSRDSSDAFLFSNGGGGDAFFPADLDSFVGFTAFYEASYAGDVNNDQRDDLLLNTTEGLYVLFGRDSGIVTDVATIDSTTGVLITYPGDDTARLSSRVAGGADINGDGINDIVIGNPDHEKVYVIFGSGSLGTAALDVGDLDGLNGFAIDGTYSSVALTQDFNLDGFGDLALAGISSTQLVLGQSAFAGNVTLGADVSSHEISISGTLSPAGDINNDGLEDLLIGPNLLFGSPQQIAFVTTLQSGQIANNVEFGNRTLPSNIEGQIFRDLNNNGAKDPGEQGQEAWTVFIDQNGNGTYDAAEDGATASTDSDGQYRIEGLQALTEYRLGVDVQAGWTQTFPQDNSGVQLVTPGPGADVTDVNFGVRDAVVGSGATDLTGRRFLDINKNGLQDGVGEVGLPGETVYLDLNRDSVRNTDEEVFSETTDENGDFRFENVSAGDSFFVRTLIEGNDLLTSPLQPDFTESLLDIVSENPHAVAVAHFNDDLLPDMAIVNNDANEVVVLENTGNGFIEIHRLAVGNQPTSIIVEDFSGDGLVDIAVGHVFSNFVAVFLQEADLEQPADPRVLFGELTKHPTDGAPIALVAADLDNDQNGTIDIATANDREDSISILRNPGNGMFNPAFHVTVGASGVDDNPVDIVAAHLDDDTFLDLATSNLTSGTVSIMINNGLGSFTEDFKVTLATDSNPLSLAAGDFDANGNIDLATANIGANTVSVILNQGDDTSRSFNPVNIVAGDSPGAVVSTDIDQDQDQDLLIANRSETNLAVIFNHQGEFASFDSFGVGEFTGSVAFALAAVDFDLDGDIDLTTVNGAENKIAVIDNELIPGGYFITVGDENISGLNFGTRPPNFPLTGVTLSNNSLSENSNTAQGVAVGSLLMTDLDTDDTYQYEFLDEPGGEDNASFAIDTDGTLRFLPQVDLNHEAKENYAVRLQVTDQGQVAVPLSVTVQITDVPEPPTPPSLSNLSLDENTANLIVGQLSSTDEDDNETQTFAIEVGHADAASFEIDGNNLQFIAGTTLDHEDRASYDVRINVTDKDGLLRSSDFTILVADLAEAPTDLVLSSSVLVENSDGPDPLDVGDLLVTDDDLNEMHSFTFVPGEGDTHNALFQVSEGTLQLLGGIELNFETQAQYSVRVQVTDKDGEVFPKQLQVSVSDAEERPTGIMLSTTTVAENTSTAAKVLLGALAAVDEDLNESHRFEFATGNGDGDNHVFTIDGSNLLINQGTTLDHESKAALEIRLRTIDKDELDHEVSLVIEVTDGPDKPTDIHLDNNDVDEDRDTMLPVEIGSLSVDDQDANEQHSFELVAGTGGDDNALFDLSGNKLRLKAETPLNHEDREAYSIRLRVEDKDEEFLEKSFQVQVNDKPDAPTGITLTNDSVEENADTSSPLLVGALAAIDEDANEMHTFTLLQEVDAAFFQVEDNLLRIRQGTSLDFETKSAYTVRVRVTDKDELLRTEQFQISLIDLNETPTALLLSNDRINEDVDTSTGPVTVGSLSADDDTPVNELTYSLVPGSGAADNASFEIAGNQLLLRQNVELNHAVQSQYGVRVRVFDGLNVLESSFLIDITSQNEPPSDLLLSNASVNENVATSTPFLIGQLAAIDDSPPSTMQFQLVAGTGSRDNGLFQIDGSALNVRAGVLLDHEAVGQLLIRVRVTDDGDQSLEKPFVIEVRNVNEAPTAASLSANSVTEDRSVVGPSPIGNVTVADPDDGDTHTLSLPDGQLDNNLFQVQGLQLQLRSGILLNHEARPSYQVRVEIVDQAGLDFTQPFEVLVTDVNEPPTDIRISSAAIDENRDTSVPVMIGMLSSDDEDRGDTHTYQLIDGQGSTDNGLFRIEGQSLLLQPGVALDHETDASFEVRLESRDRDGLALSRVLEIQVTDVNEPPTAIDDAAGISEDDLLIVLAPGVIANDIDPDHGDSLTVTDFDDTSPLGATISIDASGQFSYDPRDVSQFQDLARDATLEDSFSYTVSDRSGLTQQATVVVTVTGVNDWHNRNLPSDSNKSGTVEPNDVLVVINTINREGTRALPGVKGEPVFFYDTNDDNLVTPADVLLVINILNGVEGEGEFGPGTLWFAPSLPSSPDPDPPRMVAAIPDAKLTSDHHRASVRDRAHAGAAASAAEDESATPILEDSLLELLAEDQSGGGDILSP